MSYPVQWLDQTFRSRAKAEELLRPDLEYGVITEHDFNLAVNFLPGYHRYWPYAFGAGASVASAVYGRFLKSAPWGPGRILGLSSMAYFFGAVYGQVRRARAHLHFTRELENPTGFSQALQNVNKRVGGETPLRWSIPAPQQQPSRSDVHGDTPGPEESTWATDEDQTSPRTEPLNTPKLAPETVSRQASRWEEIRTANSRSAKTSSWDALRQGHERAQAADHLQSGSIAPIASASASDQERILEQARFDAMLEAERKVAGG